MKTATCKVYNRPTVYVPYPNAATRREIFRKALDMALVAASGVGIAAMLMLFMVL